ncbi:MAG: hypothetical protein QF434_00065 [Nitrospinaceae bacterium]|nr:hypothetical protein [Nitrospinaceae bacterium]
MNSNHFWGAIPCAGFVKVGLIVYKTVSSKEQVNAIIGTSGEKIEGLIHKLPQNRLLDMLNHDSEPFIPISQVRVYCKTTGKLLFETDFIAINKSHIVFLSKDCELPA